MVILSRLSPKCSSESFTNVSEILCRLISMELKVHMSFAPTGVIAKQYLNSVLLDALFSMEEKLSIVAGPLSYKNEKRCCDKGWLYKNGFLFILPGEIGQNSTKFFTFQRKFIIDKKARGNPPTTHP